MWRMLFACHRPALIHLKRFFIARRMRATLAVVISHLGGRRSISDLTKLRAANEANTNEHWGAMTGSRHSFLPGLEPLEHSAAARIPRRGMTRARAFNTDTTLT